MLKQTVAVEACGEALIRHSSPARNSDVQTLGWILVLDADSFKRADLGRPDRSCIWLGLISVIASPAWARRLSADLDV